MNQLTKAALDCAVPGRTGFPDSLSNLVQGIGTGALMLLPYVVDGTTGTVSIVLPYATTILGARFIKVGAPGSFSAATLTIGNGSNAITEAMSAGGADKSITRNTTLNYNYNAIPANGTLALTMAGGTPGEVGLLYLEVLYPAPTC